MGRGAIVGVALLLLAACTSGQAAPRPAAGPVPGVDPVPSTIAFTAAGCKPATIEERAARVLIVGLPDTTSPTDALIAELGDVKVGGVLLTHANVQSAPQVRSLVAALRSRIPKNLLVTVDEEPGRVRTFEDLYGPALSARRLANQDTVDDVLQVARSSGSELAGLDIDMNLAPVVDLDDGPWNGIIGDRSFSPDPAVAAKYALAYARGLQDAGVTPVIKHFPGHGRSEDDDHVTAPVIDARLPELIATDLRPFTSLIASGIPAVMMANVAYSALEPKVPASLSAPAYRLLRDMGFKGAAITDSIGMAAVNLRWNYGDATVKALNAGADGVLGTDGNSARWMRDAIIDAVNHGRLPEARLNEAAARMTALAGGDPRTVTCTSPAIPVLR